MFSARNLSLSHGRKIVVHDVDLDIKPGEVLVLCGPNGAGKSTLLSAFSGDLKPTAGHITIDGQDPNLYSVSDLALKRAVLEQSPSLSAPFTLEQLVGLSIPIAISPEKAHALIIDAVEQVGLSDFMQTPVYNMSGGQQHRAHLARTLCQLGAGEYLGEGGYLLLDEPTASLDIAFQISAMEVAHAASRGGAGVLVVLHDLNLAAAYADRIGLMKDGKMVAIGSPETVFTQDRLTSVYGAPIRVERATNGITILPIFNLDRIAAE